MRSHGFTSGGVTPEYRCWSEIKRRCFNQRCNVFKHYGGRGITMCDRWRSGEGGKHGFECFLSDMGPRPSEKHSIERRNTNGNYEPGNCEWATVTTQRRNTRATRIVDLYGEPMSLAEAIERLAPVSNVTVRMRLHRGWDLTDAILTPLRCSPTASTVPF